MPPGWSPSRCGPTACNLWTSGKSPCWRSGARSRARSKAAGRTALVGMRSVVCAARSRHWFGSSIAPCRTACRFSDTVSSAGHGRISAALGGTRRTWQRPRTVSCRACRFGRCCRVRCSRLPWSSSDSPGCRWRPAQTCCASSMKRQKARRASTIVRSVEGGHCRGARRALQEGPGGGG